MYLDLEHQFADFLEYVPYLEGNEETYSFKLLNLALGIGGYIDSALKEMAKYKRFLSNVDCQEILRRVRSSEENVSMGEAPITVPIWLCLRAFESEYRLSKKRVLFKRLPEREEVVPFRPSNPKTNAPAWWEIYNGLKHNVSVNLKKANLRNSMRALAGAFLLNVVHIPAAFRLYEFGLMAFEYGCVPPANLKQILENKQIYPAFVETPLFIYSYDQPESKSQLRSAP